MNKTHKFILCFLLIVSIVMVPVAFMAEHHRSESLEKSLDESERERAIIELSALRGSISEIRLLSFYMDIPDDVLQERLDDIITSQEFKNPYLTNQYLMDFTFDVPETSSVGELCDILISQIYDQIYTLEFGTEDA